MYEEDEVVAWSSLERMVKELELMGFGNIPEIIEAFRTVDRGLFVSEPIRNFGLAYWDTPLSIGWEQTISQPSLLAHMLAWLDPQPGEKILDVGTGFGYLAALIGSIVGRRAGGKVVTVERVRSLKEEAEERLALCPALRPGVVEAIWTDGLLGYEPEAPFHGIIASAALPSIPEAWKRQLRVHGVIIAPIGLPITEEDEEDFVRSSHRLTAFLKYSEDRWGDFEICEHTRFVPMLQGTWSPLPDEDFFYRNSSVIEI